MAVKDLLTREEIFLNAVAEGKPAPVKPLTREEMLMQKMAKTSGGATSWNDLTDKPFYEEVQVGTIIENQTVEIVDGYASIYGANAVIEVGKTYTIVFDGETYECIAWVLDMDGMSVISIGNGELGGVDGIGEDVPFVICTVGTSAEIYATDGTHTVEVTGMAAMVHAIDSKFLPSAMENPYERGAISLGEILELCNPSDYFHVHVGETTYEELDTLRYRAVNRISYEDTSYVGLHASVYSRVGLGASGETGHVEIVALDQNAIPCRISIETESVSSEDDSIYNAKVATVTVTYPLGRPQ